MLDKHARKYAEKLTSPIGVALNKVGISPDTLTIFGLVIAIATGVAVARGNHLIAAAGVALAGIPDLLDGAIARASGKANSRGAFLDSLCDRISDAALFIGAVWFYSHQDPSQALYAALAATAMAVSLLISYARAIGEKMGFDVKGGIMERAERLIVFGVFLAIGVLEIGLVIIAFFGFITLVQRHIRVWKLATEANGLKTKLEELQERIEEMSEKRQQRKAAKRSRP